MSEAKKNPLWMQAELLLLVAPLFIVKKGFMPLSFIFFSAQYDFFLLFVFFSPVVLYDEKATLLISLQKVTKRILMREVSKVREPLCELYGE